MTISLSHHSRHKKPDTEMPGILNETSEVLLNVRLDVEKYISFPHKLQIVICSEFCTIADKRGITVKNTQPWRKFENWLKWHNSHEIAGDSTFLGNVVSKYVSRKCTRPVKISVTHMTCGNQSAPLPAWASRLMQQVYRENRPSYQVRTVRKWLQTAKVRTK